MASAGNPPIGFAIAYDPSKIALEHRYVVGARILVDDKPVFATDERHQNTSSRNRFNDLRFEMRLDVMP